MKVFIQNQAGSFIKNSHNEKTLEFKASTQVSRAYPFAYGFVLNTTAEDGLNVDCFVLTKRDLVTGQIVECQAIGLMEQIEDDKEDHNVLANLQGDDEEVILDSATKQVLSEFVSHVFDHIVGKKVQAGKFLDHEAALDYVAQHQVQVIAGSG